MRVVVAIALLGFISCAAVAQDMGQTRFAPGQDCYLRLYDGAHLATHPDQRVTDIALRTWDPAFDQDGRRIFLLSLHVRGDDTRHESAAYCTGTTTLDCRMEGDAGAFTIELSGDSAILIRLAPAGIQFEGDPDWLAISGTTGDDRLFRLDPADRDACPRAASSRGLPAPAPVAHP